MTDTAAARRRTPHRGRASFWALGFGLAGAPFAWVGHQVVDYALAVHPCFPSGAARVTTLPGWGADRAGILLIDLLAVLIALASTYVAWRSLRAAGPDHPGGGEGRARFLARCGLLIGLGFLAAIVFDIISSLIAPLCQA